MKRWKPAPVVKTEWHFWWAWYPVCSIEYGWVWFRWLRRKQIPADYTDPRYPWVKHRGEVLSENLTGCWHRIPEGA